MNPLASIPNYTVRSGPLRSLNVHQIVIVFIATLLFAWALENSFLASFQRLWWRCTVTGYVALLAFVWGGNLPTRVMPAIAWRFLLLTIAVPGTLFAVYVSELGWSVSAFLSADSYLRGWQKLSGYTFLMCTSGALVYVTVESKAEARRQQLKHELEKKTLEAQALAAHMRAMQAQVEPHFLFNTLANVQQLVEQQSPQAGPLLGHLIRYLRAAVPQMRTDMTTLKREMEMAENYLAIMKMRMPDRLRSTIHLPESLQAIVIPPLAVITLVENAVQHGIDPTEHGGTVTIDASCEGADVIVRVSDTGAGANGRTGKGFGLTHLRERLITRWGKAASLSISANYPHGTIAELRFPASSL
jgi:sensor histidine kinase YesM